MSINERHLQAALSFPFIYSPYEIDGKHYYEGAAFQTLNVPDDFMTIDRFIVLNPLKPNLIRAPDDLWDAYTQSIIMPVTAIAEGQVENLPRKKARLKRKSSRVKQLSLWRPYKSSKTSWTFYRGALHQIVTALNQTNHEYRSELVARIGKQEWYFADLEVKSGRVDDALGWRRSSLEYLFREGEKKGRELVDDLRKGRAFRIEIR